MLKQIKDSVIATDHQSLTNETRFKLWQLAVLIGVPTGALVAYYLYRNLNNSNKPSEKSNTNNNNIQIKSQTSINRTPQLPKSQIEMAIDIKNEGNKFFQSSRFEEAIECYTKAIESCPLTYKLELAKFYQNRAAAYENISKLQNVIDDCTAALNLDPNYSKALHRRSKALESLGRLEEAFEDLTTLCLLDKFSSATMTAADRVVKKLGNIMAKRVIAERVDLPISQHFVNNFFIGLKNDILFDKQFLDEINSTTNEEDEKFKKCFFFNFFSFDLL
jgi:mitochondrial import receptor subunit TOM70